MAKHNPSKNQPQRAQKKHIMDGHADVMVDALNRAKALGGGGDAPQDMLRSNADEMDRLKALFLQYEIASEAHDRIAEFWGDVEKKRPITDDENDQIEAAAWRIDEAINAIMLFQSYDLEVMRAHQDAVHADMSLMSSVLDMAVTYVRATARQKHSVDAPALDNLIAAHEEAFWAFEGATYDSDQPEWRALDDARHAAFEAIINYSPKTTAEIRRKASYLVRPHVVDLIDERRAVAILRGMTELAA